MRMLVSCISRARPLPLRPLPFLPNFLSLSEKCTVPLALSSAAANAPLCLKVGGMAGEREGWKGGKGPTHGGGKRAAARERVGRVVRGAWYAPRAPKGLSQPMPQAGAHSALQGA